MTGDAAAVLVRPAVPADAEALARCHLLCWGEAYTGLADPDRLAAALAAGEARAAAWRRILGGRHATLVALDGAEVVGFASTGPGRDDDLDLALELYALYVRQHWWGRGLGHRLLVTALGEADSFLWLLRENVRARGFYARHGFLADGLQKPEPVLGGVDVRMVRRRTPG